ncbi:MAG: amino acid racemase [Acidimicrobiia bacterium]|nr:amino acid racemase [Acidimicrobiia bacterium]
MRTIGILGGIGPQATMDFESRIHRVAQWLVPQHGNEGYPPMVTVYMRHPPVRVDADAKPVKPLVLDPRLLDSARRLGEWADLIVIPSNTPHLFLDPIREASGCTIISMIDVTVEALHSRGASAVGLIGLGIPQIYIDRFTSEGLRLITAEQSARVALDDAIIRLMEGAETDANRNAALEAVEQVRAAGAPLTVLGCTEIPLLLGEAAEAADLINPAQLLAEAAVRYALDGSPN